MFSFFKRTPKEITNPLRADMHSHLLPNLDDGVASFEESESIILTMKELGITKIVTTPHIMQDTYRNSSDTILPRLGELKKHLAQKKIEIQIEAAAEYYLDEELIRKINDQESLLTFGERYLLFETNYLTEPYNLKDFIFKVTTQGYRPILAHPERYQYMSLRKAEDLRDRGVLFQINMLSLIGFYSKPIQSMAYKLIDQGWIEFLGSDCHNKLQAGLLQDVYKNKHFRKALDLPLLNHTLNQ